jgi:hypothetical protein
VTTPDFHVSGHDALEALLLRTYTADIPETIAARLDENMARAIEARQPWYTGSPRVTFPRIALPRLPIPRPLRVAFVIPVVLALVMLNAVSQTGGAQGFFDREGGYTWTNGQKLELTETVAGYKVTLHRAYADANQLMLAATVVDVQQQGVWIWTASVVDGSGTGWVEETGTDEPPDSLMYFSATTEPAQAGLHHFTATFDVRSNRQEPTPSMLVSGPGDGTTYTDIPISIPFDLSVGGGVDKKTSISAESQGITMTLDRITTAPSMVRITLHILGTFPEGSDGWLPTAFVTHNGMDLPVRNESGALGESCASAPGCVVTLETSEGVDDPDGDWSVTATEVGGNTTDPSASWGHEIAITGTWTLDFTLP